MRNCLFFFETIIIILAKITAYGDVILVLVKLGIKTANILPVSTSPGPLPQITFSVRGRWLMISHICIKLPHLPSTFIHSSSYMFFWLAEEAVQTGIFICILERTPDQRDKIGEVVQIGIFICILERTLDQRDKAAHTCTQLYLFAERKQHLNRSSSSNAICYVWPSREAYTHLQIIFAVSRGCLQVPLLHVWG